MAEKVITTSTIQPDDPAVKFASPKRSLSEGEKSDLSVDLMNALTAGLSARAALDRNLDDWEKLYEMELAQSENDPWPDASNICVPIVPAQLETALAYIVGRTLVPRFILVSGNTTEAQQKAYYVERYYNAELVRQRGSDTWYEQLVSWLNKSFHGGTSIMEVLWVRRKIRRRVWVKQPKLSRDGTPVVDPITGQVFEYISQVVTETVYDDVRLEALKLRDFGVIPASAPSINEAVACWRKCWFYESELMEMVEAGTLWKDEVEASLQYIMDGASSGISTDRQGVYDKTTGKQVDPHINQGSQTSKFFKNRGPLLVHRIHSRAYDMDGDGVCEENIFYFDLVRQRLLGYIPYEYPNSDERPFIEYSWAPREDTFAGFSFIERLTQLVAEINKINNDRNNAVDLRTSPPLFVPKGTELQNGENTWGPNVIWEGEEKPEVLPVPDIPIASSQEESTLMNYVNMVTGQSQPIMGAQSSGRRTKAETTQQASSTGTRNDLVAIRFRIACRELLNFIHRLKKNYTDQQVTGQDGQGELFSLPPDVLKLDFRIDVSGATDPVDADTRLNKDMGIYQMAMQSPIVQMDMLIQYKLLRKVLEAAGYADVDDLIGTVDQMQQKIQAQQQAAQQQAKQQAAMGQQPGQKPQNGQQPHGAPAK